LHGKCDYLKEERRDSFLQLFVAGLNIPLTRNVVVGGLVFYGGDIGPPAAILYRS